MPTPLVVPLPAASGGFGRTLEHLLAFSPSPAARVPAPGGALLTGAVLVEVPGVTSDPVDTALRKVRDRRLVPRVALVESAGTVDTVKTQDPKAGDFLPPGGVVTLYVITAREPTAAEELIEAIRQAIKPGELAKTTDLHHLATRQDLHSETAALEKEAAASKRFEELKALLGRPSDKPSDKPTSSR
ncbi:hypothetical protein HNQ09_003359 [Deinococcus budaensis]|uniref:PASTA domain-containing protein n=1 Tax=Deinococcus budaensis TaxID=1665626 RepID=A0A7W8LRQ0_9DEIO|nr:PASTA domain-containing protein [Deinococcus budaensis]MBB5235895.1 hypothetical protein [Deinococcus budaensis]